MKPMTEQEARAALKAEMPWAKEVDAGRLLVGGCFAAAYSECIDVEAYAPTLRAAVEKAIKAWRNTQRRVPTQKKGAKR